MRHRRCELCKRENAVAYLVAALCSLVWHSRNLSSFKPFANPYFDAIVKGAPLRSTSLEAIDCRRRCATLKLKLQVHVHYPTYGLVHRRIPTADPSSQFGPDKRSASTPATNLSGSPPALTLSTPIHLLYHFVAQSRRAREDRYHTANMSFRPASRIFTTFRPVFRQPLLRRRVQTAASPAEPAGFAKFWNSPVGPKTVHFWYASYLLHFTLLRKLRTTVLKQSPPLNLLQTHKHANT